MKKTTWIRSLSGLLGCVLLSSCSSQTLLPREELRPGASFASSEVRTDFGDYRFDRVKVAPDSLIGEYSIEVQRQSSEYGVYYEDVVRTRAISLDDVVSVSTKKRDAEKTIFVGAGTVAVTMLLRGVFDSEVLSTGGGSSRTKPDPR